MIAIDNAYNLITASIAKGDKTPEGFSTVYQNDNPRLARGADGRSVVFTPGTAIVRQEEGGEAVVVAGSAEAIEDRAYGMGEWDALFGGGNGN